MKNKPTFKGINPPSHWTKVVSSIAQLYGVSFADAKFVYDRMREVNGRTPSLRAVAKLPNQLPLELWNPPPKPVTPPSPPKQPKQPKTKQTAAKVAAKVAAKAALKRVPPRGIKLPPPPKPPPPPSEARPLGKLDGKVKPRNAFEKQLQKDKLPLRAISRKNAIGKLIGELPDKIQIRIAKALGRGYRQIENRGYVSITTITGLKKLVKKYLGKSLGEIPWNFIFKFLYGKK